LNVVHGLVRGVPPTIDLDGERRLQDLLGRLASARLIRSAHDCSDGGLAVTLAECCFGTGGIGAEVSVERSVVLPERPEEERALRDDRLSRVMTLFGESASRVVLSTVPDNATIILEHAAAARVPARIVGETGGNRLRIAVDGHIAVDVSVDDAERVWESAIEHLVTKRVA
jgi:phosphoribosylformylglycinamidine synthase